MPRAVSAIACLLLVLALPAVSQEPPSYEGTAEVVAVDAVVDLSAGPGRGVAHWLPGGRNVRTPDSLEATVHGAPAPVVAVDGPGGDLDRIVLYFDLSLSDDHQLTWSAARLGDRARELVARGPVEVVVATPVPVTTLQPTRDATVLEEALGRVGHLAKPLDDLVELRLSGPEGTWGSPSDRERELVREGLDALLLALVDRSAPGEGAGSAGPKRAVFLATGGFDPERYREAVSETGRVLAAYGWRVVPVLAPERRGLLPGKRIGKWRFSSNPKDRAMIVGVLEEHRDPERAEAYLSLAQALRDQGELERAAKSAEDAAFHFYGDPETADREVEALLLAASLHQRLGNSQRARRMLRQAGRIDPEALEVHPVLAAVPRAAAETLDALAEPSGGATVRSSEALRTTLERIAERAVVTVQAPVAGPEDGLALVVVRDAGGGDEVSGWVRIGTPKAVEEVRGRARR
jgi:hypothetical protein